MKKRMWIIVLIVCLLLVGGTVISAVNYTKNLALVTTTSPRTGRIQKELNVIAGIYYEETEKIALPEESIVTEVLKKEGDRVEAGEPLLYLDMSKLWECYYKLLLEIEKLEDRKGLKGNEAELVFWQREQLEEQSESLKRLIDAQGLVTAPVRGCVLVMDYESGDRIAEKPAMELGVSGAGCYLTWEILPENYRNYTAAAVIGEKEYELYPAEPEYNGSVYVYHVPVRDISDCKSGSPVEVTLKYVSKEYRTVVPVNCLRYDSDGVAFVYELCERTRNYGKEYYVRRVSVLVSEADELNAVVHASPDVIVESSSKVLSDLDAVNVMEKVK